MASRRMNTSMQVWNLNRLVAGSRHDTDQVDVRALADSRLSLSENREIVRKYLGISTRNKGLEAMDQGAAERARERVRRQNPYRQTGPIQGTLGHIMDMRFQAMRPGRRISEGGHRYYERRENRSDRGKLL